MSDKALKEHLEILHTELQNTKTVDKDSEILLQEILVDVQTLLSHKGKLETEHHEPIRDRFVDSARHFDVSHPSLASTIRTVVHTLNNIGI